MNDNTSELGITLAKIFRDRYVVPLYQRNFAWRTDEIQQLLQDIYDSYQKDPQRYYYIGSLVVMKRHNGDYEVIDGQQRLTVMSLIASCMRNKNDGGHHNLSRQILFYDSRPEVQKFFELLWCNTGSSDAAMSLDGSSLFYLKEAYTFLHDACIKQKDGKESKFFGINGIPDYILNHVVLVRNVMPEDTDVAAYFEIMNNRGEQLKMHEIVKAKIMAPINDENQRQLFAKIWDACSQMNVPIQRLFSVDERRRFFGGNYDVFCPKNIFNDGESQVTGDSKTNEGWSLAEVLDGKASVENCPCAVNEDEAVLAETDVYAYESIIDFPNFLMHVLRLHLRVDDVPLNEKDLLSVYDKYSDKINPVKFAELLLFCL